MVAIEYAKVVETEMRLRFLPALAEILDRNTKEKLVACGEEIKGPFSKTLPGLMLGKAADLIDQALGGPRNRKVLEVLERIEPGQGWNRQLVDDLKKVAHVYRNGAAHIERRESRHFAGVQGSAF